VFLDDKVAFYLLHRLLIDELASLREQAATELEEALVRAVGIARQRPTTPPIIDAHSGRHTAYGINLEIQGAETGRVLVALGWTHGELLKPAGTSWPYMGVKIPDATKATLCTAP
jgi:hypothetical protein